MALQCTKRNKGGIRCLLWAWHEGPCDFDIVPRRLNEGKHEGLSTGRERKEADPRAGEARTKADSQEEAPQEVSMDGLTAGRIVHFVVTEGTAGEVNRRRADRWDTPPENWPAGAQRHTGNPVYAGEHLPMIVVAVWPNEFGPNNDGVNGQVFLDGNDSLWVTSVRYDPDATPGTWHWIERA
jgi:hypothetical protein